MTINTSQQTDNVTVWTLIRCHSNVLNRL